MSEGRGFGSDGRQEPGWHEAPDRSGRLQFWNGTVWTEHFAPMPPAPPAPDCEEPPPSPPPRVRFIPPQPAEITSSASSGTVSGPQGSSLRRDKVVLAVSAVGVALIALLGVAGSSDTKSAWGDPDPSIGSEANANAVTGGEPVLSTDDEKRQYMDGYVKGFYGPRYGGNNAWGIPIESEADCPLVARKVMDHQKAYLWQRFGEHMDTSAYSDQFDLWVQGCHLGLADLAAGLQPRFGEDDFRRLQ